MSNFVMLWNKTLDSSIWLENNETRILWFTFLMMKDKDGVVLASRVGLANRARLKPEECEEALKTLTSPDKNDTSGVEKGVRLKVIPGGWEVINHDAYKYADAEKRALWAEQKALQRAAKARKEAEAGKKPAKSKKGSGGFTERVSVKAYGDGDTAACDRLAVPTSSDVRNGNGAIPEIPPSEVSAEPTVEPLPCDACGAPVVDGKLFCKKCRVRAQEAEV